jgi:hypothetical protein
MAFRRSAYVGLLALIWIGSLPAGGVGAPLATVALAEEAVELMGPDMGRPSHC